eukprot:3306055-Alexandrium_andersonii.AAC.1
MPCLKGRPRAELQPLPPFTLATGSLTTAGAGLARAWRVARAQAEKASRGPASRTVGVCSGCLEDAGTGA